MRFAELKKDTIIIEWLDTLNPKPNTERNYLVAMQAFTEWVGKTPEEILTEAEQEIKAGKLMRERNVKKYLIGFRKYMQDSDYAPISVKNYLTGVKSFYKLFDIEIPTLPRTGNKARPLERHSQIPDKEDVQQVLTICDPLEKAIVLCGVSSGLSANEIINLKVGSFKKGYDPETEITTLKLRRAKVGYDFITFLTPEASRAVWAYLKYREREAKTTITARKKQFAKQRIYSDDNYLFIGRQIPFEYLDTKDEDMRKLEHYSLMKLYRAIAEKAGKCAPLGNWNMIRSHNMRKYFNSALLNAGCDSFFVEFTMGHTLDDTRSAYFRASPEKLKKIYAKFVPYLTIQKELDVSASSEYREILKENNILRAETAKHIVERTELSNFKQQMEENEKRMKLLTEMVEKLVNV
ncbi:tyrosine-type recombinase/integrase [uncultured Methanomethylovorans sp.]|uniref:tyrosine-type recombinase/integrase n=1 Tax=uncultured Methanomethylovorans sp. TaxID=183759 RepID=UPI002AA73793|nr:tyrosine-type recombinase/integrase [uncultured Methanomethylovorans sp.]